jgi:hypothetical protein
MIAWRTLAHITIPPASGVLVTRDSRLKSRAPFGYCFVAFSRKSTSALRSSAAPIRPVMTVSLMQVERNHLSKIDRQGAAKLDRSTSDDAMGWPSYSPPSAMEFI